MAYTVKSNPKFRKKIMDFELTFTRKEFWDYDRQLQKTSA